MSGEDELPDGHRPDGGPENRTDGRTGGPQGGGPEGEAEAWSDPSRPPEEIWRSGPVLSMSDRPVARFVARPVAAFLRIETSGAILLLLATLAALLWVNCGGRGSYDSLWTTEAALRVGSLYVSADLREAVNDGLMALFFLVVGLEIKYSAVAGELRDRRFAAVPVIAAFGGMAVPALLYLALNGGGGEAGRGWGVPMATDIAFALGVLALLGRRVPQTARVFLLTLAIVDDLGAITVIAVFYTERLSLPWLAVAVAVVLVTAALRGLRVWAVYAYVALGIALWLALYESGVHATLAGVAMGLLCPARPLLDQDPARRRVRDMVPEEIDSGDLRRYRFLLGETVPVTERLQAALHPWSSYLVLPVFALANAGVPLTDGALGEALTSPVTAGVVLGLVVGKTVGILLFSWLAVRLRLGELPTRLGWPLVTGLAVLGGIGFTVALFITALAFGEDSTLAGDAKVGILAGSLIAAVLGAALLALESRHHDAATPTGGSPGSGSGSDSGPDSDSDSGPGPGPGPGPSSSSGHANGRPDRRPGGRSAG